MLHTFYSNHCNIIMLKMVSMPQRLLRLGVVVCRFLAYITKSFAAQVVMPLFFRHTH